MGDGEGMNARYLYEVIPCPEEDLSPRSNLKYVQALSDFISETYPGALYEVAVAKLLGEVTPSSGPEVARIMGVTSRTVGRWITKGWLVGRKIFTKAPGARGAWWVWQVSPADLNKFRHWYAHRGDEQTCMKIKAQCKRGHSWTIENRAIDKHGHSSCRLCKTIREREKRREYGERRRRNYANTCRLGNHCETGGSGHLADNTRA